MNYSTSWAPQALPLSWVTSYAESRDLPTWGNLTPTDPVNHPSFSFQRGQLAIIVYNPSSGSGKAGSEAQALEYELKQKGLTVKFIETERDYHETQLKVASALANLENDAVVFAVGGDGTGSPVIDGIYHANAQGNRSHIFCPDKGGSTNDKARGHGTNGASKILTSPLYVQEQHLVFIEGSDGKRYAISHSYHIGDAIEVFAGVERLPRNETGKTPSMYNKVFWHRPSEGSRYYNTPYWRRVPLIFNMYFRGGLKEVTISKNGKVQFQGPATEIITAPFPNIGNVLGTPGANPALGEARIVAIPRRPWRFFPTMAEASLSGFFGRFLGYFGFVPRTLLGKESSLWSLAQENVTSLSPGDVFEIQNIVRRNNDGPSLHMINGDPHENCPENMKGEVSIKTVRTLVAKDSMVHQLGIKPGYSKWSLLAARGAFGASILPSIANLGFFGGLELLNDGVPDWAKPWVTYGVTSVGNGFLAGLSSLSQKGETFVKNFFIHLIPLKGGLKMFVFGSLQAKAWEMGIRALLGEETKEDGWFKKNAPLAVTNFMMTFMPMYEAALDKLKNLGIKVPLGRNPLYFLKGAPALVGLALLFSQVQETEKKI